MLFRNAFASWCKINPNKIQFTSQNSKTRVHGQYDPSHTSSRTEKEANASPWVQIGQDQRFNAKSSHCPKILLAKIPKSVSVGVETVGYLSPNEHVNIVGRVGCFSFLKGYYRRGSTKDGSIYACGYQLINVCHMKSFWVFSLSLFKEELVQLYSSEEVKKNLGFDWYTRLVDSVNHWSAKRGSDHRSPVGNVCTGVMRICDSDRWWWQLYDNSTEIEFE